MNAVKRPAKFSHFVCKRKKAKLSASRIPEVKEGKVRAKIICNVIICRDFAKCA